MLPTPPMLAATFNAATIDQFSLFLIFITYEGGTQKALEFIYKKLSILTCLNFSHLRNALHLCKTPINTQTFELVNVDAF